MNVLYASSTPASLVPGLSCLIIAAQKIPTEWGIRLFIKLRAAPKNIFYKMPGDNAYLLTDYQIEQINNEKLFINFSFWGTSISGHPIIQIRNAALPSPTSEEMALAGTFGTINSHSSLTSSQLTLLSFTVHTIHTNMYGETIIS